MLARLARGLAAFAVLAVLLVSSAGLATAESLLRGIVRDQQSQQPIAGASVAGGGARAVTNEAGRFSLGTPQPLARVTVTRVGYLRQVIELAGVTGDLEVSLVPAPVQQQEVQVTGRALAKSELTTPVSTASLSEQDLRRGDGLQLENSINTVPGVVMQSRTPWGGAHIQVRGYYPNFSQNSNGFGMQTYLDGMPITDASGQTILDDVDYSALGRLDIVKGPSSSLYGGGIGGTVNLWTARPARGERGVSQQIAGGSDGLFRTNTTYGASNEHSDVLLAYGHQTYDSFRPNSRSKKDYARFLGDFRVGDAQTVTTFFSYANSYEQLAGEIDSTDFYHEQAIDNPVYLANRSRISIESQRAGFTHSVQASPSVLLRSTLFTATQTMSQPFAHGFNDYNRFSFGARTAAESKGRVSGVEVRGSTGAQFQRTNYTVNGFFLPSSRPSDQENYAMNYFAFSEWNASLPMDVTLSLGGALAWNEFGLRNMLKNNVINDTTFVYRRSFDPKFTPRGAISKRFRDELTVYGSIGTGFTPPSLTSFLNSNNIVNEGLRPEAATQYEAGAKGLVWNRRVSYDATWFDLEIRDKLVSQRIGSVTSTTNVGHQRNRGIELTTSALVLDGAPGFVRDLRPWLSYTWSDCKYLDFASDANDNGSTVRFDGKTVARVPEHVFNLGLDAETREGVQLFASYQHVSDVYVTFDNRARVLSYDLLGARLGWHGEVAKRWKVDLSAGGDNLLGATWYRYVFVGPNLAGLAWPKDGGTGDGYILPASYDATYYGGAKVTYTF